MSAWIFETGALHTCGKLAGAYLRVELATQDVTSYPLTSPVWTSPTQLDSPFTFGDVGIEGAWDAGQQALADVTFEALNVNLDPTGDTRLLDILNGVNRNTTDVHVRVSWSPDNSTWTVKFWGVLNWTSVEINYGDFSDEDTWLVKFSASDCIAQLQRATTEDWFSVFTYANYEYVLKTPVVAYITNLVDGYSDFTGLRYLEHAIDGSSRWLDMDATTLRLFKIGDLFQSMSDMLGLEANICNQASRAALPYCTQQYGHNDSATTTPSMSWATAAELYVIAGLYAGGVYKQQHTFFCPKTEPVLPHYSVYENGSVAESLKSIATSIGCVVRIEVNASGERYLNVVEVGRSMSTRAVTLGECIKGAELVPYERAIDGVQVTVVDGTDVTRPGASSKSVNVDCIFSSINNAVPRGHPLRDSGGVWRMPLHADVMTALWRGYSSTNDKNLDWIKSICAVVPRVNGTEAVATAQIDAWGAFQDSSAGLYVSDAVIYPRNSSPYCYWTEAPAMALAHMLYSSKTGSADISVFRQQGQSLRLKVRGITATLQRPGDTVTVPIAGVSTSWTVVSCREVYSDDIVEYELERYD